MGTSQCRVQRFVGISDIGLHVENFYNVAALSPNSRV
jgi:hypothetical protein